MPPDPKPFSFVRWLLSSLRRFVTRVIVVVGGLQSFNYLFGGDDAYKEWALSSQGEIAICLAVCLLVNLMYDWERSNEP